MKTIKPIKQLVEAIASDSHNMPIGYKIEDSVGEEYSELIDAIRNKYLPLFQFNIDVASPSEAQAVYEKIAENVKGHTYAAYLPDGQHTSDKVGALEMETPTIMEWQNSGNGQNFVINYNNRTAAKGLSILNQLVVDMLLALPNKSVNLHFIDLVFSGQAAFLTRN